MRKVLFLLCGVGLLTYFCANAAFAMEGSGAEYLKKMVDTYSNLNTYQEQFELTFNLTMGELKSTQTVKAEFAYQKGLKFRFASDADYVPTSVYDGKNLVLYVPALKQYKVIENATKEDVLTTTNIATSGIGVSVFRMLAFPEMYKLMEDTIAKAELEGEEKMEGKKVRVIKVVGKEPFTAKLWIGANDNMLYKIEADLSQLAKKQMEREGIPAEKNLKLTITEVHKNITLNKEISPDKFKFSPPSDAKKVEDFITSTEPPEEEKSTPKGKVAPAFALKDFSGKEVALESFRGKIVVLDFWAAWCGPCRVEIPRLQKLHEEYKEKGVVIIGVNLDRDKASAEKMLKDNNITFLQLRDEEGKVSNMYGVTAIPTLVIIDENGNVVDYLVGVQSEDTLKGVIDSIKSKKAKPEAPTKSGEGCRVK